MQSPFLLLWLVINFLHLFHPFIRYVEGRAAENQRKGHEASRARAISVSNAVDRKNEILLLDCTITAPCYSKANLAANQARSITFTPRHSA